MLWKVIPDRKNSEYDMFCCAIVKADNKDEAETFATKLNNLEWETTNQVWTAREIDLENIPNGIIYADFNQG